jgi:hypothetical protein
MDPFTLEATVHRVGGSDYPDRVYGPWATQIIPDSRTWQTIQGRTKSADAVTLEFARWTVVRPGLLAAELAISTRAGQFICPPRPVLYCTLPCDVPIYSSHVANDPELGVYSVGLRQPRSAWVPAPADVAVLDADKPPAATV